jgi:hypothetical protein
MIDSTTNERVVVSDAETPWPYIIVPIDQLEAIERILQENRVTYWLGTHSISINGKPQIIFIKFPWDVNAGAVQRLLDSMD